jgi:hypothetical protein
MRVGAIIFALAMLLVGATDARAAIGPGVLVGGCTSNFVFRDATDLYLGYAAHCARDREGAINEPTEPVEQFACAPPSLPPGTQVEIEGASAPGVLAYSAWWTMREVGETDEAACERNDFAIVRIARQDHAAVNPSVPVWGGPTGLRRAPVANAETFLSFGRSNLRGDVEPLKPRQGYVTGTYPDGWRHNALFVTSGLSGDSGSAVLDGAGGAAGVLVTIEYEGSNGITNLAQALDYMKARAGLDVRLVNGTAPFAGAPIPELVASPPSQPDPAPQPAPEPAPPAAPAPAPVPQAASPPATAPPAARPKPKPKAKTKAKTKRKPARCRTRGANRRSARGKKAPKCARRKPAPRRRR